MSTVALIERRPDISRDLFTRYWRDVHGVMAARIPGFLRYTQFHVTPVGDSAPRFEGIAIVTFACEADREGLATSEVTPLIHRDEQNVFKRALLYNLGAHACTSSGAGERTVAATIFLVFRQGVDSSGALERLEAGAADFRDIYDLTDGDPADWNDTDTPGERFTTLIHAGWDHKFARDLALQDISKVGADVYRADCVHIMVDGGRPTPVGLRGLDAVRTINEAGAINQLTAEVEAVVFKL